MKNFKLSFTSCLSACTLIGIETYLSAARIMVSMLKIDTSTPPSEPILSSPKTTEISGNSKNRKKRSKKKHCCLFCRKLVSSMSRHILNVHKEEQKVLEIAQLSAQSIERKDALRVLRLRGDKIYNEQCRSVNSKISMRQSKNSAGASAHCTKCDAFIAKRNFARHDARCTGRIHNYQRTFKVALNAEDSVGTSSAHSECGE